MMLATFYHTGARASEIAALRVRDINLDHAVAVHIRGKGRKERTVPLWKSAAVAPRQWLPRICQDTDSPLFPNRHGAALSRSGIEQRLSAAIRVAVKSAPTLKGRRISPYTLRHTTAMHLLQSGVDITVIALWLGHESPATTHLYIEADLAMKERALKKLSAPPIGPPRYRASDRVLAFLEGL